MNSPIPMNVLTELRELSALFDGRADITDDGGPNEAMRIQQVLADIEARVAELMAAVADGNTAKADHSGTPIAIYLPEQTARLRAALSRAGGRP